MRGCGLVLGLLPFVALGAARPLRAQGALTLAQHVALGDSAHAALRPAQALEHFRAALALDSTNYEALWKAGRELVDIAKQIEGTDEASRHRRDSLYSAARDYGEAAVRANPNGADGHFIIAQALGRLSRTRGGKERVRFAKIIYDEAMRAVQLDSTHDGAYHDRGNWADAQRYLERAVALRPAHIFHRLELGEVYVDVGKYSKAREQFAAIDTLPVADVLDPEYKRQAKQLLADIRGLKDEG